METTQALVRINTAAANIAQLTQRFGDVDPAIADMLARFMEAGEEVLEVRLGLREQPVYDLDEALAV